MESIILDAIISGLIGIIFNGIWVHATPKKMNSFKRKKGKKKKAIQKLKEDQKTYKKR